MDFRRFGKPGDILTGDENKAENVRFGIACGVFACSRIAAGFAESGAGAAQLQRQETGGQAAGGTQGAH